MTISITTNPDAPLTIRALDAATQRNLDTAAIATWRNPHWAQRAEACATALAHLLGVPRGQISVHPDLTRAYGHWVWPTLTVTEPGGAQHEFTAAYNDPEQLIILGRCPDCGGQVPLIPLRHLADLGEAISGTPTGEPAHEFHADPGHHHLCQHHADQQ
ncbi:hypothetical protein [Catenulispora subtropica]|uniref:Uncharacterized protein n=1 Tax=Catenulispora subtropica TaxID=450798 RepID=A0ABP5CPG7_9ACTN